MRDAFLRYDHAHDLFRVSFDVVDGVPDGLDFLGILVRNLDLELFLEREHELDDGERIRLEVIRERGLQLDLVGGDLELLDDDFFDLFFDFVGHCLDPLDPVVSV